MKHTWKWCLSSVTKQIRSLVAIHIPYHMYLTLTMCSHFLAAIPATTAVHFIALSVLFDPARCHVVLICLRPCGPRKVFSQYGSYIHDSSSSAVLFIFSYRVTAVALPRCECQPLRSVCSPFTELRRTFASPTEKVPAQESCYLVNLSHPK